MFRLLRWFLLVAALAFAAVWLADNPGTLLLDWQGYRIESSFVALLFASLFAGFGLSGVIYSVWRGYGWIRRAGGPSVPRYQRGLTALAQGMTAIAAGDARAALSHAARADVLLGPGPLSQLMRAQAAQLAGDEAAAGAHFTAMAAQKGGEFMGVRGMLGHALRTGDAAAAQALAARAQQLQPKSPWVNRTRFDVHCAAGEWAQARETLETARKARLISGPDYRRRRGVLALAQALEARQAGTSGALALALEAVKYAPGLAPASVLAAELLAAGGGVRRAGRLLEAAWAHGPHPELAAAYAALAANETATQRRVRFGKLLRANPDHPETRILGAELAAGTRPGADPARREQPWLWICNSCARRDANWAPVCPQCDGFDSQVWRPAEQRHTLPAPVA